MARTIVVSWLSEWPCEAAALVKYNIRRGTALYLN